MKHEATTLNTKKAFVASLKRHMEKKPLSKISVTEIIADCGVNRKTFYYHFDDIYSLLKWMLEQEAFEVVKQFDLMVDYEEALLFVMNYVDANKHILNCAYDSMGRDELKRFLYSDFIGIMHALVDKAEKMTGQYVDETYKNFVCDFYVEALAGMLINWFRDKSIRDRTMTLKYLVSVFKSSMQHVFLDYAKISSKMDNN